MTEHAIVLTQTEAEIDDVIASKIQDGWTYGNNKHYSEGRQEWVANFTKETQT